MTAFPKENVSGHAFEIFGRKSCVNFERSMDLNLRVKKRSTVDLLWLCGRSQARLRDKRHAELRISCLSLLELWWCLGRSLRAT